MKDVTTLQAVWFILIAILWLGYFVLEGFDFGVGMLIRSAAKNEGERRSLLHTIGPVWDGNEVWLIVAGGATFAAFPEWYATLFSGFYLALFLILGALIVRNVAFEFWGKRESPRWRLGWEWAIIIGSLLPALLWGVGWANIVGGVPIDAQHEYTGTLFTLLKPYALVGGLATLAIFLFHGALFLSLRSKEEVERRARAIATKVAPLALVVATGFLVWTVIRQADRDSVDVVSAVLAALAVVALAAAVLLRASPARAFAATTAAIVLFFSSLFVDLYPHAMISSTDPAFSMTLNQASSSNETLTVMTVVAVIFVPIVLLYQAWTYWVFRHRVGPEDFGDVRSPLDLLDSKRPAPGDPDAQGGSTEPTS